MRSNLIDIDAELVHETDKAWLLNFGDEESVWLPKSVCEFDDRTGTLTIPQSMAQEKGLI